MDLRQSVIWFSTNTGELVIQHHSLCKCNGTMHLSKSIKHQIIQNSLSLKILTMEVAGLHLMQASYQNIVITVVLVWYRLPFPFVLQNHTANNLVPSQLCVV